MCHLLCVCVSVCLYIADIRKAWSILYAQRVGHFEWPNGARCRKLQDIVP